MVCKQEILLHFIPSAIHAFPIFIVLWWVPPFPLSGDHLAQRPYHSINRGACPASTPWSDHNYFGIWPVTGQGRDRLNQQFATKIIVRSNPSLSSLNQLCLQSKFMCESCASQDGGPTRLSSADVHHQRHRLHARLPSLSHISHFVGWQNGLQIRSSLILCNNLLRFASKPPSASGVFFF